MGYTTEFTGEIRVEPALNVDEISFLEDFIRTRHMNRVRGPLYAPGDLDGTDDLDVIDMNNPGPTQPGLWCKWESADYGHVIRWDGREKFYDTVEWMQYLIDNLFSEKARDYVEANHSGDKRLDSFTFNHVFNGVLDAQGEDEDDKWLLIVKDNAASRKDIIS